MTTHASPAEAVQRHLGQIETFLAGHGITRPRLAGLAAAGRPVPPGVPIELHVTIAGVHDWTPADLARLDRHVTRLAGHPVLLIHQPR